MAAEAGDNRNLSEQSSSPDLIPSFPFPQRSSSHERNGMDARIKPGHDDNKYRQFDYAAGRLPPYAPPLIRPPAEPEGTFSPTEVGCSRLGI